MKIKFIILNYQKNIEKKNKEYRKKYYEDNKIANQKKRQEYRRKIKYGLNEEEYQKLISKKGFICHICRRSDVKLGVDHNHITNKIRGLLCNNCNFGVGSLKDNIELLQKAIEYLKEND